MLKGFWFFKLSHSALLAYFIGKTEPKILPFVCTFFHFFRQGKILKLSVDGLTLKTETLASPSSRYDLKIISCRYEQLSDQLSSALRLRFDCGCARLDPNLDPNIKLEHFRRFLIRTNKLSRREIALSDKL